jgi:L-alanine-DL-glutamate epimerase-like enolase superfamily enzyme
MKITAVESILLTIPYRSIGMRLIAGRPAPGLNMLLVRLETDSGLTGWGEAFGHAVAPATRTALDTIVAPMLIGRDAPGIAAVMDDLQRRLHLLGRNGPVIYALSGVDIALWDLAGKAAGLPLHRLLGGAPRATLSAYASLTRCSGPDAVAESCRQALEQGFSRIKLHEITLPAVQAARATVGPDVTLMLDTNCPWSRDEARAMIEALRRYDLHWLEEPLWPPEDYAGLAQLRATGMTIAAGENSAASDFPLMFELGALDVVQPSVTKVGGVSEMRRIIALAEKFDVRVVPHCPYLGPGFLASLHLTVPLGDAPVERIAVELEASPFGDWIDAKDGEMRVPQGPGLGCDPDAELIARYRTHEPNIIR